MKTQYLWAVLGLLLSTQIVHTQDYAWQYAYQVPQTRVRDALTIDQDVVIAGGRDNCTNPIISYFDANGEEVWRRGGSLFSFGHFNTLLLDADSTIVAAGRSAIADDVLGGETVIINRYDQAGTLLDSIAFDSDIFVTQNTTVLPLIQLGNGDFVLGDVNRFHIVANDFTTHLTVGNLGGISQIEPLTDSTFVVNAGGNLAVYKSDGTALGVGEDLPFVDFIFRDGGGRLFLLSDNNVYQLSPMSLESEFVAAGLGHNVERYTVLPDSVLLYSTEGMATWFEVGADTLTEQVTWNYPRRTVEVIEVIVDATGAVDYVIAGQNKWQTDELVGNQNLFEGAYAQRGNFDLELSNRFDLEFLIGELVYDPEQVSSFQLNDTLYEYLITLQGTATIRNRGLDTLHNFAFFTDVQGFFNCAEGRTSFTVSDIAVPPLSSFTFEFPYRIYRTGTSPLPTMFTTGGCFYVAVPNRKLDKDLADNATCANIIYSPTHDPAIAAAIRVFPNPAQAAISIEADDISLQQIRLIDGRGRELRRVPVQDQSQYMLFRENLPAGVYYLQIVTSQGRATKRVLFQ